MYSVFCLLDGKDFLTSTSCTLVCECKSADSALSVLNTLVANNTNDRFFYKVLKK